MSKFHINKHGVPAPCKAIKGNCPLGGDSGSEGHFDSQEDAQAYADEKNESQYGLYNSLEAKDKENGEYQKYIVDPSKSEHTLDIDKMSKEDYEKFEGIRVHDRVGGTLPVEVHGEMQQKSMYQNSPKGMSKFFSGARDGAENIYYMSDSKVYFSNDPNLDEEAAHKEQFGDASWEEQKEIYEDERRVKEGYKEYIDEESKSKMTLNSNGMDSEDYDNYFGDSELSTKSVEAHGSVYYRDTKTSDSNNPKSIREFVRKSKSGELGELGDTKEYITAGDRVYFSNDPNLNEEEIHKSKYNSESWENQKAVYAKEEAQAVEMAEVRKEEERVANMNIFQRAIHNFRNRNR